MLPILGTPPLSLGNYLQTLSYAIYSVHIFKIFMNKTKTRQKPKSHSGKYRHFSYENMASHTFPIIPLYFKNLQEAVTQTNWLLMPIPRSMSDFQAQISLAIYAWLESSCMSRSSSKTNLNWALNLVVLRFLWRNSNDQYTRLKEEPWRAVLAHLLADTRALIRQSKSTT